MRLTVLYLSYSTASFITFIKKKKLDYVFQRYFVSLDKTAHWL